MRKKTQTYQNKTGQLGTNTGKYSNHDRSSTKDKYIRNVEMRMNVSKRTSKKKKKYQLHTRKSLEM